MVRGLLRCLVTAAMFSTTVAGHAATRVNLSIDTRNAAVGAAKSPADQVAALVVTLADGETVCDSANQTEIYDLNHRRLVIVDKSSGTYVDYSLYAIAGFRTIELQNRLRIKKMAAAMASSADAKISMSAVPTPDLEQDLSVLTDEKLSLTRTTSDGATIYSVANIVLARQGQATFPAAAPRAQQFAQFLRFYIGGHPLILQQLAASGAIPGEMVFTTNRGFSIQTVTVDVTSVEEIEAPTIDLTHMVQKSVSAASDGIDATLDAGLQLRASDAEQRYLSVKTRLNQEYAKGQSFDAFEDFLELSFMHAQPADGLPPNFATTLRQDPDVTQMMTVLAAPHERQAMTDAVKTIQQLETSHPERAYLMRISEADDLGLLGDSVHARQLLISAIQTDPYMAAPYKDLGDVLLSQGDALRAWRAWEIGRRLYPSFANFAAITQFEAALLKNHPEYF